MESYMLVFELGFPLVGFALLWGHDRLFHAREILIRVDEAFPPNAITVRQGERLRLRFLRRFDRRCTREIVFPSLKLRRALSVGEPTTVTLRPRTVGVIEFTCGMNLLRGTLEVRPQI